MNSVRTSKFRNVFGSHFRRDECYNDLRLSTQCSIDSSLISVNSTYLAANWQVGNGGAFVVVPLSQKGRLPLNYPVFSGHAAPVVETAFSPFYEHSVASASDDGRIMLWNIPQDGIVAQTSPALRLGDTAADGITYGHTRRIQNLVFHPTASDVLASSSIDCTVKIWDVKKGVYVSDWRHPEAVSHSAFNLRGTLIASTCRDKNMRIFDSRCNSEDAPAHCISAHEGSNIIRVVFAGDNDNYVITTGSSRSADRQINLFDTRNPASPVQSQSRDKNSGALIPHFDRDCNLLYLAAKGDGFLSHYEFEAGELHYLNAYGTSEPFKGIAFAPKSTCQTSRTEILRIYKAHNNWVEPISLIVPRKAGGLQTDLFPPTLSCTPAMTAAEFFEGKDADPIFVPITELRASVQNLTISGDGTETPKLSNSASSSFASPMSQNLDAAREKLAAEISAKNNRINELESELADCKTAVQNLQEKLADNEAESDAKDAKIKALEHAVNELNAAFEAIQNKMSNMETSEVESLPEAEPEN